MLPSLVCNQYTMAIVRVRLRSGTRESIMSSKGLAHVELKTSEVKKLRTEFQQMTGKASRFCWTQ